MMVQLKIPSHGLNFDARNSHFSGIIYTSFINRVFKTLHEKPAKPSFEVMFHKKTKICKLQGLFIRLYFVFFHYK